MSVAMKINEELNGIELYFESKPSEEVRQQLRSNKFRFSYNKMCWYTKQSETALKIAEGLTNGNVELAAPTKETKKATKKAPVKKEKLSLWNATRYTEMDVNTQQDTKQIAKEVRQHVKKRFPQVKFSVTSDYSKINVTIKESPYKKGSKYLEAVKEYVNQFVNAYNYCTNYDPYGDYGSSYNFYFFNTSTDYDYKQTEVTEAIQKDMKDFDTQLEAYEQAEEERKEKEFQVYLKEQEARDLEYKKQREEEKKQEEQINNNVEVKDIEETEQYYIIGASFANLNKNNTLDQYKEEVTKSAYTSENVKVTREIHFTDKEALTNFSNMLLHDFDFLSNTGGSFTDDNRINSMTDFHNMDSEERKTVQWNLYGVAVYYNSELQFVVDAQGYNYARYVGLTDNATIQKSITVTQVIDGEQLDELKQQADELETISSDIIFNLDIIDTWKTDNWSEYKETFKDKLNNYDIKLNKSIIQQIEIEELKTSMYKLLTEGIQEQFKKADIQQGEKVTLFYISDWGSIVTHRITFDSAIPSKYAQYNNAIKLTFTPERKRKLHYKYFYSTMLVYKGWYSLPTDVLNHVEERNGMRITRSKFHSCDKKQYDEILNHFEESQGLQPIVNTYKPTF